MDQRAYLAYLTPNRTVAWKCLSLEASGREPSDRFAPVAYASLSRGFFPGAEGTRSPGVVWVISTPTFSRPGQARVLFPPTLTAKVVVDRVLTGDVVRRWALDERDRDLDVPSRDAEFQRWRRAASVPGRARRATFRITRDFAMIAWRRLRARGQRQHEAWARVRTAVADRRRSRFCAHVDAGPSVADALHLPAGTKVGTRLQSPRLLRSAESLVELEDLAAAGTTHSIFMNYRWNDRSVVVARLARRLLRLRCGVWLDGLAIPHFAEHPIVTTGRAPRRRDPPAIDLERLLRQGIASSSLFLCLAAPDYLDPPDGCPERSKNWAVREYEFARARFSRGGAPIVRVVDLGGAPESLLARHRGRIWTCKGTLSGLATKIAAMARRA